MLSQQRLTDLTLLTRSQPRAKCSGGRGFLSTIAVLAVLLPAGLRAESPDTAPRVTDAQLKTKGRIAADLEFLSSDALKGRDTGSREIDQAAEFIASRFESLGFNVALFDGGPFQEFSAVKEVVAGPEENNGLKIEGDEVDVQLQMGTTMAPLAIGGSGTVSGPIVFAGYGITAPDEGYDDYAGLDVDGKIVAVLRGEPRRGREDKPLAGRGSSRYAFFVTKVKNAIDHGAAGLLIINHAEATRESIESAQKRLENQTTQLEELNESLEKLPTEAVNAREKLENSRGVIESQLEALRGEVESSPEALLTTGQAGQAENPDTIPVASVGRRAFENLLATLFDQSPQNSIEAIEAAIDETVMPVAFQLPGLTAVLKTDVQAKDIRAKNVVAELPGVGPLADETIVIGAHYDHVGMGGNGSLAPGTVAIHNGADDNASGTVTMLELAHRLAEFETDSRRRIVFIAFSAEERGLLGSKHYARQPRFSLENTAAMINLDMVGRLDPDEGLTVFGTGTAPSFDSLVDQWNEKAQLPIFKDPSGYGPSDHTSFYEKDIPVLFFFTGLHPDYHRPTDDFDKINLDGMVRITDMVYDAATHLATVAERPQFQKTGPGQGVGRRTSPNAYLGVQLEDRESGVFVTQTVSEGPAAAAGIRNGDRIVSIGETTTNSTSEVQTAVGNLRPGSSVSVVVSRDGEQITVEAKVTRRP
jgi:hypothetical protein